MKLGFIGKALVLGSFCVISSTRAQALDFNFSVNANQGYAGTITGIIRGLSDNSTTNAPNFTIEVLQSPYRSSIGIYSGGTTGGFFTVNNQSITDAAEAYSTTYNEYGEELYIVFGLSGRYNGLYVIGPGYSGWASFNELGFNGVQYSSATAVPFDFDPAFGAALGLPLFIGLRYLKKRVASKKLKYNPTVPVS